MNFLWQFFVFELKFRAKSISTYVYFLIWFTFSFLCVASENFGPVGSSNGKVFLNTAYANSYNYFGTTFFGIIVVAAIFGTSILRDFQRDTYQFIFTKPISKFSYLGGRWAGSFVTTAFCFSGEIFGGFVGTYAPWADRVRIAPNHMWAYLQPFLSISVVQIFFLGSLFFAVAALTRKIFVVYLQGIAVFMIYIIGLTVFSATQSLERFWSGIFDPVGFLLLSDVTRYWTVLQKNSLYLSWSPTFENGVFLYNRLFWLGFGFLSLGIVWVLFPMSVEALTARSQGRRAAKLRQQELAEVVPVRSLVVARLPLIHQVFNRSTSLAQYGSLTWLRVNTILHEIPFWAILALLLALGLNNGYFAGHQADRNVWPVTYLMLQSVEGNATLFLFIVATLYAAELLWRERDTGFHGIHDALPISESIDWLSRLSAICVVELALLTIAMLSGVVMQTVLGYYHYEFGQYFKELYLVTFPQVLTCTLLALFIQTVVSNKFVGHAILIGILVLVPILYSFGLENTLYLVGNVPTFTYSDMNGYGHFVPAIFWSNFYWLSIASFLGVLSVAMARRGAEESLRARLQGAVPRLRRLAPLALFFAVTAIGSGCWYYYNAHILNEYLTADDRRHIQADYEMKFKKYQDILQPKITAVEASIDIFPDRRSFKGHTQITLQNKTAQPITQIHITDVNQSVKNVKFDRAIHQILSGPRHIYNIYSLDQPLAPGEVIILSCDVDHESRGFRDGNELAEFAYDGTFFDSGYFPHIGYDRGVELDDPRRRREQHLPPLQEMAHRGNPLYSTYNLFSKESDWITFHATVSTSPDQIAIAPGYLKHEWLQDNRRYFEYSMGSTHIQDFFSFLSGRYKERRETYHSAQGDIALEIYYNPAHTYDLDDMLSSSRAGLDYYQKAFSPYQFTQYRILEFPRYRRFAQSFPNTVPYSEGIGFIGRVVKPTDIDITYFVTAHELGHQWWGHQLIGADVEGSNMMSESLAEYSALQVMAHKYGRNLMHRYLVHELDTYLRGRSGETRHEPPLALVQREPYVWYQKGGQILYTLADYIGEDNLNLALRSFLMQYRYANADNQVDMHNASLSTAAVDHNYPDTRMLVDALMTQTPPELRYMIDDGFNHIVLYDNKAISATSEPCGKGQFKVTLDVQARKVRVDDKGAETPVSIADFIEIGVFKGKKDEEVPLSLKKEKLTGEHQRFSVVVNEKPTRAGIDPYNKLIDRIADDNMIPIIAK